MLETLNAIDNIPSLLTYATYCKILQQIATDCNGLQEIARCNKTRNIVLRIFNLLCSINAEDNLITKYCKDFDGKNGV